MLTIFIKIELKDRQLEVGRWMLLAFPRNIMFAPGLMLPLKMVRCRVQSDAAEMIYVLVSLFIFKWDAKPHSLFVNFLFNKQLGIYVDLQM